MADVQPGTRTIAYDRFRRVTARRLTASVTTKPHVTLHRYAGVDSLEHALAAAKERTGSPDLGLTAALAACVARAVAGDGRLNGTVDEQLITLHDAVHLGVAVDVDGALVVPVLRDAATRPVAELGADLKRLSHAARAGTLRPDEVAGATFTMSSLGALGVELFTPVINPPQLAILGVGAVTSQVVAMDQGFAVERRIGLSLSFDHAATDGADAARVLQQISSSLEHAGGLVWTDDGGALPPSAVAALH